MTWCSKIYDIFNGWNEGEHELPSSDSSKIRQIHANFHLHNQTNNNNNTNVETIIQHDSPFLEKSDSLITKQSYNNDYSNRQDYRHDNIYNDALFSSHQLDEQYYFNPDDHSYGIATISNTSLNLPQYIGNPENNIFQEQEDERQQQQLSRSYSFEFPMELKQNQFTLSSYDDITPRTRFSLNQQTNRHHSNAYKSNRFSLNHGPMNNSQVLLRNGQEQAFTGRISTRSTYSVPDYESNELQSQNNEQIEREVQYNIKELLNTSPNGVFPMIYRLPMSMLNYNDHYRTEGGYGEPSKWMFKTKILPSDYHIIVDNISSIYTHDFYEQYHLNLYAIDDDFNPIVMSIKPHDDKLSVILRTKDGSKYRDFSENGTNLTDYVYLAKQIYSNLHINYFENCSNFKAQQLIKAYDDKLETQKFKFGIIYQRRGQTTEEEFFNNEKPNQTFNEFLDIIATKVSLKNFKGYRGGLDVSEQTDSPVSYYECYDGKEIMFHVSTLLPFTHNDTTQIQRKRHIGNDIVAIVFQEENTPFHPSMIKSNFLHVFLVIQPVQILSRTCYKMMLVARDDIEQFPPVLQPNLVYVRTAEQLKPFILSKLINAEYAAYRCRTFSLLQERTRCSYLKNLCESLTEKSYENLCDELKRANNNHRRSSILSNSTRKRYISSMKKMFTRSNSAQDPNRHSTKSEHNKIRISKKLMRLGKSMDSVEDHQHSLPEHINARSDESLNSSGDMTNSNTQNYHSLPPTQVYYGDESDEGLDSMSSADTARAPYDSDENELYRQHLREKSHPIQIFHRVSNQRHILMPQTAGIHLSEEATV